MGEIILIAVVALLVVGPDRLPSAAKAIGKGIRDLRQQTREFQQTIEKDTEIGGAVRELRTALRGDPESLYKAATGEDFHQEDKSETPATKAEETSSKGEGSEYEDETAHPGSEHHPGPEEHEAGVKAAAISSDREASSKAEGTEDVRSMDAIQAELIDPKYANADDAWGNQAVNPHLDSAAAEADPDLPRLRVPEGSLARSDSDEPEHG